VLSGTAYPALAAPELIKALQSGSSIRYPVLLRSEREPLRILENITSGVTVSCCHQLRATVLQVAVSPCWIRSPWPKSPARLGAKTAHQ
jgi:hypothetical protein